MKIVQTFWSGNGNPLTESYGWLEPQYHLMSWALSCLSLRENYDKVVMYTDSVGLAIFSKLLDLPYTEIIVQYDNLICPKHQWAYSKMFTYSLQEEPFLHIDGDVYLPKRLGVEIEKEKLIVQNREFGTKYYRNMIDRIKSGNIIFPDFLEKELQNESISSYNAGILGGNDIEFIQKYCKAAFDYIDNNQLFDVSNAFKESHNILFEQILFYALSVEYNKNVSTILETDIKDNGYSYRDFCDFYSYDKCRLMHIIGGHKKRPKTCELLSRTLMKKYPEYYQRIIELFPNKHKRVRPQSKKMKSIQPYQAHLNKCRKKWERLTNHYLLDLERKSCNYLEFLKGSNEKKLSTAIKRNPQLSIYERQKKCEAILVQPQSDMACIPTLLNNGLHEVPIDDLSYDILVLLDDKRTLKSVLDELQGCFEPRRTEDLLYQEVEEKLEYLFYNKLIYIDTISYE